MIKVKIYKTKGKIKQRRCILPDGYIATSNADILMAIRKYSNEEFKFVDVNNGGADITYQCLLNLMRLNELESTSQEIDLVNVIKNGGLVSYINKLENK